jgi:hypothetical protein
LARSAFISRREGRYIFQIRTPACLSSVYRSGSIRLALGTANYQMASTRAARIASWMLRIRTMDGDPREAMVELWPRLQALALEPVRNEGDYVERSAFQAIAFEVQFLVRQSGAKPDDIVAGWGDHFLMLLRENGRAGIRMKKNNSLEGRIERRRETAREAGICRTISKNLSASLVGERLSHVTKRQFQPAATLLDFLWRADRETFSNVVRAIDWSAIDATIGEDWEHLFHDGEVFLRIAYRDKEAGRTIAAMVDERLKDSKSLQPRLAT